MSKTQLASKIRKELLSAPKHKFGTQWRADRVAALANLLTQVGR